MEIDFVVTWVDMDDPKWKEEFNRYCGKIDNSVNELSEARFRDHGFLKYWFRGVDTFAPWVRKIHFVTSGQHPVWLNTDHPKLNLVQHKDYIPEHYLPVFNSNLIEIYLHKIPDLSNQFVYFNDDFFIINHLSPKRFFEDGLPKDIAAFRTNTGISQFEKMLKNNIRLINKHFDKKEVFKKDAWKWHDPSYGSRGRLNYWLRPYNKFITLRTPHNAQPFLKSTFEEVWKHCNEELEEMGQHRFRNNNDYTPELFRTWQICCSNFLPYNTYKDTKMFSLLIKSKKAIRAVREQSYSLVCLNDNIHIRNYQQTMEQLKQSFEMILPERSSYEL
ncbi:Stealth CR1 domain-containing protein [Flavobacteriaceae bacterium]|nr:Stealth CR1 domain-containing protein [Flavobacteriaceae bacterium]MDC3354147.1 Stealth CR1 domain-containing protein [Flavobacteriaceae bacterium]